MRKNLNFNSGRFFASVTLLCAFAAVACSPIPDDAPPKVVSPRPGTTWFYDLSKIKPDSNDYYRFPVLMKASETFVGNQKALTVQTVTPGLITPYSFSIGIQKVPKGYAVVQADSTLALSFPFPGVAGEKTDINIPGFDCKALYVLNKEKAVNNMYGNYSNSAIYRSDTSYYNSFYEIVFTPDEYIVSMKYYSIGSGSRLTLIESLDLTAIDK